MTKFEYFAQNLLVSFGELTRENEKSFRHRQQDDEILVVVVEKRTQFGKNVTTDETAFPRHRRSDDERLNAIENRLKSAFISRLAHESNAVCDDIDVGRLKHFHCEKNAVARSLRHAHDGKFIEYVSDDAAAVSMDGE